MSEGPHIFSQNCFVWCYFGVFYSSRALDLILIDKHFPLIFSDFYGSRVKKRPLTLSGRVTRTTRMLRRFRATSRRFKGLGLRN